MDHSNLINLISEWIDEIEAQDEYEEEIEDDKLLELVKAKVEELKATKNLA